MKITKLLHSWGDTPIVVKRNIRGTGVMKRDHFPQWSIQWKCIDCGERYNMRPMRRPMRKTQPNVRESNDA